ncbi:UDP-N-acetylmuramoyl-L-alanine--D-glutamate ligase [Thermosulfurimonas dismutans]|uniref:UDP-N-acetylmuramoylalanine--D-glutamate ligase n=1 Tax=Thermosulfurimonas dismutans TaxID=999894 RepID=A0A179D259_9BACT|nr:UDP-N-acetylmuramoyl-L-alanine--D-glutamate ligase [Thermosulfurimonas dismutans]OAQ20137.1 UDP-N-acetylmuramoylalanine--D-glutamate ligase [Thermosulfurimonas dismutans]
MISNLRGLRTVVLGFGRSGKAAARLLAVLGAEVTVSERRAFEELPPGEVYALTEQGVRFETGGHRRETLLSADLIVVSPGIPPEVYQESRDKGIPVIGELELAYCALKRKDNIVAVTGTNGKTTTTAMVSDILKLSGFKVFTGGNFGVPLSEYVLSGEPADWVVLEVSSFQLETSQTFKPRVGVILNLTPDHLERYKDLTAYARAKLRLLENLGPDEVAMLPHTGLSGAGGEILLHELPETQAEILFFGDFPGLSVEVRDRDFVLRLSGGEEIYPFAGFRLLGRHNRFNFAVAALSARLCGATPEAVRKALVSFVGFPHRLEYVGSFGGVYFVNDSKATNVDATLKALEGLSPPIVLIAGGLHKGASYRVLYELIRQKVRVLILMGASRFIMAEELSGATETLFAEGLPEALALALRVARPGDTVLLSPAAASFDQFESYEERGEVFRELVMTYAPKVLAPEERPEVYH